MFFKRESVERGSVKTDREPIRSNLYCALSRIIYAWADRWRYLSADVLAGDRQEWDSRSTKTRQ